MALIAGDIVTRVSVTLNDTSNVRYAVSELLTYISDGQRRVVQLVPAAFSATTQFNLATGSKQTLPGTALRLLDVVRNSTSSGTPGGRPVRQTKSEVLDEENINWHFKPTTTTFVEHFVYEPNKDAKTFYVYPPPATTALWVDIVISKDPPAVTAIGNALSVDPQYHEPIIDYVIARAVSRDAEQADEEDRAEKHMNFFLQGIGFGAKNNVAN